MKRSTMLTITSLQQEAGLLEYSLNYALTVCHADGSESTYTENDLISYFQSEKKQATFANIYASKEEYLSLCP